MKSEKWSLKHLVFSVTLAGGSCLALVLDLDHLAYLTIGFADGYLLLMFAVSAGFRRWSDLPYKLPALLIVPLVFLTLVFSFAVLYHDATNPASDPAASAFRSYMNMVTFSYDSLVDSNVHSGWMAGTQVGSAVLLLLCAFPLLMSRLADFSDCISEIDFNGCMIFFPRRSGATVSISGDTLTWRAQHSVVTAKNSPPDVQIAGSTVRGSATAKLVVIRPDGAFHIR